jgi:hypothetical protein
METDLIALIGLIRREAREQENNSWRTPTLRLRP